MLLVTTRGPCGRGSAEMIQKRVRSEWQVESKEAKMWTRQAAAAAIADAVSRKVEHCDVARTCRAKWGFRKATPILSIYSDHEAGEAEWNEDGRERG